VHTPIRSRNVGLQIFGGSLLAIGLVLGVYLLMVGALVFFLVALFVMGLAIVLLQAARRRMRRHSN
jgi:hypothetical protein